MLHDVNLALRHADKVLLLKDGVQIAHGDTAQVMTQSRLEQVYDTRLAELSDRHGQRAFIAC
ncbi:Hemin import ATP-binding protein HmuV [compost metagenome]